MSSYAQSFFKQYYLRRLFDAAENGTEAELDVIMARKPKVLEEFLEDDFVLSPLHVSVKRGHYKFTMEILRMFPDMVLKHSNERGLPYCHFEWELSDSLPFNQSQAETSHY
ncbi:hypothetical protein TorRG33x02_336210 [Trema orientale]|uniref:Ankyrin repeat-containing domain containing protein n=1 Tax=Trema orientale TaxID=63057 RepID=A0A2P5B0B9_TREOI|nr:hypothetical protein TorRG33x02_336210 [Trema orientale]